MQYVADVEGKEYFSSRVMMLSSQDNTCSM